MSTATMETKPGRKKKPDGEKKKQPPKQEFTLNMVEPMSPSLKDGKLIETPKEWSTKYKPIKRELFVNDSAYLRSLAKQFQKRAESCLTRAAELEKLGNVKDRDAAKRFLSMKNRILELGAKMTAEGNGDFVTEALKQLNAQQ